MNKNRTKWAYFAWLISTYQIHAATDNYMLVGHTHDLMDAVLAIVSRWLKTGIRVLTLQDLATAIHDAFAMRKATSVITITVLTGVHNWIGFFTNRCPPIEKLAANVPDIERPHRLF